MDNAQKNNNYMMFGVLKTVKIHIALFCVVTLGLPSSSALMIELASSSGTFVTISVITQKTVVYTNKRIYTG